MNASGVAGVARCSRHEDDYTGSEAASRRAQNHTGVAGVAFRGPSRTEKKITGELPAESYTGYTGYTRSGPAGVVVAGRRGVQGRGRYVGGDPVRLTEGRYLRDSRRPIRRSGARPETRGICRSTGGLPYRPARRAAPRFAYDPIELRFVRRRARIGDRSEPQQVAA